VLNDRTLAAIVEQMPTSEDELGQIAGIGPTRLERYGGELLELVRQNADRPAHAIEA
jgi:superfamily II DNA helicase RecQ